MSDGTGRERLDARVIGSVQGVGFRWYVAREAARLGLTGWVANEADGSVRVVAEGPSSALDEMVGRLENGPPGAAVERVTSQRTAALGEFSRFEIRSGAHPGD